MSLRSMLPRTRSRFSLLAALGAVWLAAAGAGCGSQNTPTDIVIVGDTGVQPDTGTMTPDVITGRDVTIIGDDTVTSPDLGGPDTGGGPNSPECQTCVQGAVNASCSTEVQACMDSPPCLALAQCANNCTDQTCLQNCVQQNPDGSDGYQAIALCAQQACAEPCGGTPGECSTCGQVITGQGNPQNVCPASVAVVNTLNGCICSDCATDCGSLCDAGGGQVDQACQTCITGTCGTELSACMADDGA